MNNIFKDPFAKRLFIVLGLFFVLAGIVLSGLQSKSQMPNKRRVNGVTFTTEKVSASSRIFPPEEKDIQKLDQQRHFIQRTIAQDGYKLALNGSDEDLTVLQKLIDDNYFTKENTLQLQAMGIVLGDVMQTKTGLKWAIIEDEFGRDVCLRFKDSEIVAYPRTMISKRIERGETNFDLTSLIQKLAVCFKRLDDVYSLNKNAVFDFYSSDKCWK